MPFSGPRIWTVYEKRAIMGDVMLNSTRGHRGGPTPSQPPTGLPDPETALS